MSSAKALILRAPGINCERETKDAFERAGAACAFVHIRKLLEQPTLLDGYSILALAGGFAYGDDIAAGRILAHEMRRGIGDGLLAFLERGGLVLGICNGFQVLVRLGLLPRTAKGGLVQEVTLTHNLSNHYECRWVTLRTAKSKCVFVEEGMTLRYPAAHGEGYLMAKDAAAAKQLVDDGYLVMQYVDADGVATTTYPANPNGSPHGIAALTDVTGRVLGVMPHPDRAYLPHHMPDWRQQALRGQPFLEGDGLALFTAMVKTARAEG